MFGPVKSDSLTRHYVTYTDKATRYRFISGLCHKSDTLTNLRHFLAHLKTQYDITPKVLRTDNGGEYKSAAYIKELKDHGIVPEYTAPHTPQENGIAERLNDQVMRLARSLLLHSQLPDFFWAFAAYHAIYLLNRMPSKSQSNITPYEAWFGDKPDLSHLRTFGCYCEVLHQEHHSKLSSKTIPAIYLGHDLNEPSHYQLWNPATEKFITSCNVSFVEGLTIKYLKYPTNTEGGSSTLLMPSGTYVVPDISGQALKQLRDDPESMDRRHVTFFDNAKPRSAAPHISSPPPEGPPSLQSPSSPTDSTSATGKGQATSENVRKYPTDTLSSSLSPRSAPYATVDTFHFPDASDYGYPWTTDDNDSNGNDSETSTESSTSEPSSENTQHEEPKATQGQVRKYPTDTAPSSSSLSPSGSYVNPDIHRHPRSAHNKPAAESTWYKGAEALKTKPTVFKPPDPPRPMDHANLTMEEQLNYQVTFYIDDEYGLITQDYTEPLTLNAALKAPDRDKWIAAMEEELANIGQQNTLGPLQAATTGLKIIDLKWVYKVKLNPNNSINKYKARIVGKGFQQRQGIDFHETYAPVARMTSIRILLAIAAAQGFIVRRLDVVSAYLHGKMDTAVYVRQPPGFINPQLPNHVHRLNKALYGLKQAGRLWNTEVNEHLLSNGFTRSQYDQCIYTKQGPKGRTIIGLYVDDFIYFGPAADLDTFEANMAAKFSIKLLGPAKHILGLQLTQDPTGIIITQEAYIKRVIEDTALANAKASSLPITGGDIATAVQGEIAKPVPTKQYLSLLGRAMYAATCTRPDIAFAVGYLGRYSQAPTQHHMKMVITLLRYLKGTTTTSIRYPSSSPSNTALTLVAYSDADFAGSIEDRHSTTGSLLQLRYTDAQGQAVQVPIYWRSKKQSLTALSTAEAEYIAAFETSLDIVWIRGLLQELGCDQGSASPLHIDNQACISIASNTTSSTRTKHIDIRHHKIRELIADRIVTTRYAPTKDQLADILTKALARELLVPFIPRIGLSTPSTNSTQ